MGSERVGEPLGQAGPTRRAQGLPRGSTAQPGPERRLRPAAQDADATATGPPPCGSPASPPASRHRALKGELCAHPLPVTTVGTGAVVVATHGGNSLVSVAWTWPGPRTPACSVLRDACLPRPTTLPRTGTEPGRARRARDERARRWEQMQTLHHLLTDTEGRGPEGALPAGLGVAAGTASRQGSQGAPRESWGQTTGGGGGGRRGQALGAALRSGPASSV